MTRADEGKDMTKVSLNSVNTGTIIPGKGPMFRESKEGGNNYKCRRQF